MQLESVAALYNDDPIDVILGRLDFDTSARHSGMDIEAWFRASAIDNKDAFCQFRVWEVATTAATVFDAARRVLEDPGNYCFGSEGRALFDNGQLLCVSEVVAQPSDVPPIIDSMVHQLSLERGVSRLCAHVTASDKRFLILVVHHLLVDTLSWEYIATLIAPHLLDEPQGRSQRRFEHSVEAV